MIHLGDITKISGYEAPIVDCVIGGSPCQDLSVAGKRAGLDGERSGLFIHKVRIVKEMREHDKRLGRTGVAVRPRYLVWENVPGALSSGKPKGEDFRIVLEEIARIADENAVIPRPTDGKWTTSGCIMGDGWSIAWRVQDAQFWGVPQRRRRIALIADFGGASAPEILFVRNGLYGDTDESQQARKETATAVADGVGVDDRAYTLKVRSGVAVDSHGKAAGKGALVQTEMAGTIAATQDQYLFQPVVFENHSQDSRYKELGSVSETVSSKYGTGGNNQPIVVSYSKSKRAQSPTDYETWVESKRTNTLNGFDVGDVRATDVVIALDRASYNQGKNAQFDIGIDESGTAQSLIAKGPGAVCYSVDQGGEKSACNVTEGQTALVASVDIRNSTENPDTNGALQSMASNNIQSNNVVRTNYIVRRLTPLECERLQGFPDGWTDIGEWVDSKGKKRKTSDANRYKALGNSIALPPWKWVLKRLCAQYERDATMASLFDGIGGFPLIWEQLNGEGSCLWASEIEEFPMAVTK